MNARRGLVVALVAVAVSPGVASAAVHLPPPSQAYLLPGQSFTPDCHTARSGLIVSDVEAYVLVRDGSDMATGSHLVRIAQRGTRAGFVWSHLGHRVVFEGGRFTAVGSKPVVVRSWCA